MAGLQPNHNLLTAMKKTVILFAATLLCSCGGANYTLSGRYELPPGDSVDLLGAGGRVIASGVVRADTTVLLKGSVAEPGFAHLVDRHRLAMPASLFLEPGDIRIEGLDEEGYIVSGTPLNDKRKAFEAEMKVFINKIRNGSPEQSLEEILSEMDDLFARTVDANPDNIFGVHIFTNYVFPQIKNDPEKVRARIARFTPEMQAHPTLKRSQVQAEAVRQTAVGQPFTDLTLRNAAEETVTLSSLVRPGRWVLLDFWATWCKPCMVEVPHLKAAYDAFKEKGFEIYGVSLDSDPVKWKKVIAEEGMNWTNTVIRSDDPFDATALYDISSIPTNFLIAPDGTIAAKNLRGEQLREKLEELLK